jgi:outer membrane protein OmpA-like peptidoglycan-associated protein
MKNLLLLLMLSLGSLASFAQDIAGSKDHPLIDRFPGSTILNYYTRDYNEVNAAVKPGTSESPPAERMLLKGKHTSLVYEAPQSRTSLEIIRNFQNAINAAGGEVIFQCSGAECDGTSAWYNARFFSTLYGEKARTGQANNHYYPFESYHAQQQYLLAKIPTETIEYFVEIAINPQYDGYTNKILLEIVESKPMDSGLLKVNAKVLQDQLDKEGKIALYGIKFDTGKSTITPDSESELNAVASYLKSNPAVRLYVVGHTDDTGDFESNLSLSKARAESVVTYLTENYGVDKTYLMPWGAGPTAPKSTNMTEKGKTENRRVELVKRL